MSEPYLAPGEPLKFREPQPQASALEQFNKTADRLKTLTSLKSSWEPIPRARLMPAEERNAATRVRIDSRDDNATTKEAAIEIMKRLADEFEARGHQKRRQALDEIAHEIDTLRAQLPQLALDAALQMGEISRMCREEASK